MGGPQLRRVRQCVQHRSLALRAECSLTRGHEVTTCCSEGAARGDGERTALVPDDERLPAPKETPRAQRVAAPSAPAAGDVVDVKGLRKLVGRAARRGRRVSLPSAGTLMVEGDITGRSARISRTPTCLSKERARGRRPSLTRVAA